VVTDHRSLIYASMQENLSPRQVRWWEFLSCFNFRITYVKGSLNVVADALSRKFEGVPAAHSMLGDYLSIDKKLDPDGDELPGGAANPLWRDHDVVSAVPGEQVATLRARRKRPSASWGPGAEDPATHSAAGGLTPVGADLL
jgi:hypothetical protein